jgi:Ca-activated chloride channel family protein
MKPTKNTDQPSPIPEWMLTAFALSELDSADHARVEQEIAGNIALQEELRQIQSTLHAVQGAMRMHDAAIPNDPLITKSMVANIARAAAERSATGVALLADNPRSLKERPFYRRKRFAAMLATAALIPVAAISVQRAWTPVLNLANGKSSTMVPAEQTQNEGFGNKEVDKSKDVNGAGIAAEGKNLKAASNVDELSELLHSGPEPVAKADSEGKEEMRSVDAPVDSLSATIAADSGASPFSQKSEGAQVELAIESEVLRESLARDAIRDEKGPSPLGALPASEPQSQSLSLSNQGLRGAEASGNEGGARREILPGQSGGTGASKLQTSQSGNAGEKKYNVVSPPPLRDVEMARKLPAITTTPLAESERKLAERTSGSPATNMSLYDLAPSVESARRDAALGTIAASDAKQGSPLPVELRHNVPDAFRSLNLESRVGDRFEPIVESPFVVAEQSPLSTFSIDVDTASYSKVRQYLMQSNRVPDPNMVRIEELINYFEYEYAGPTDDKPFAAHMAIDRCPWNTGHRLVRIGLQAKHVDKNQRANANIVFLLDVSGSMDAPNKLPLVKRSLSLLASQLGENDRVAIVVYAGAAGCVLPSTSGANKQVILTALDHLNAGGSTNGGQGIQLAYSIARENFIPGGVNRVILCTDGDFNVGVTGDDALVEMMQANAKSNVFLTCLGFGIGNYNDAMMEKISNKGNGVYGMIDNEIEARRMMVEQLAGTLVTVAKDVKIQVDFNPAHVASYRLIGYEDRKLANRDFDDDRKDAGEIGAGHRVTALYEVVPVGALADDHPSEGDVSKYQPAPKKGESRSETPDNPADTELLTLKIRYKQPEGSESTKQEFILKANQEPALADLDLQWAESVAEFGLLLRGSRLAKQASWSSMLERATLATKGDAYRLECLEMMKRAHQLFGRP